MTRDPLGVAMAAVSVVSSGMQQLLCRSMQQQHALSATDLLAQTAPLQVHLWWPDPVPALNETSAVSRLDRPEY